MAGGHSFLCVWVPVRESLRILVQNTHKGLAREISHETGRGRGKKGPRDSESEESSQ